MSTLGDGETTISLLHHTIGAFLVDGPNWPTDFMIKRTHVYNSALSMSANFIQKPSADIEVHKLRVGSNQN